MASKSKINALLTILFIAVSIVWSCTPKPTTPAPVINPPVITSLKIIVSDVSSGASTAAVNAKVQLYKTDADRAAKTNPTTGLVVGDANGVVMFDSLSAIDYYYNAYSNDMTKSNGPAGNHTTPLTAGVLNTRSATVK